MKTLKLAMVAIILSVAVVCLADSKPPAAKKVVCISLSQAMSEPGLVAAMYDQLGPAFLGVEHPGYYWATVKYNNVSYRIFAPRKAWKRFFLTKPVGISQKIILHQ